jgi:hypothetical protein
MGGGMLDFDAALENRSPQAGERTVLRVRVSNAGADVNGDARVRISAPPSLTLVAASPFANRGPSRDEVAFVIPSPLRAETYELDVDVYALDAGDAEIALQLECEGILREASVRCVVRTAPAFAPDANSLELFEAEADAGAMICGRAIVTNTGYACATIVAFRAEGDLLEVGFDAEMPFVIEGGTRRIVAVRARVPATATDGSRQTFHAFCVTEEGAYALGSAHVIATSRPRLEGSIEPFEYSDIAVAPGERVHWRMYLMNAGGADADLTLALHVSGGVYQAGSSRLDGARVIDAGGASPLWSHDGIRIEGLPAGSGLCLEFATLADAGTSMHILARACCDGRETLFESPAIALADRGEAASFPFRVHGVDARRDGVPALEMAVAPAALRMYRTNSAVFEPPAASYLASLDGLMRHLWALAVLCADACDDPDVGPSLSFNRVALRSVFDRLAIKLRMPHYPVRADDVLDPLADDALAACGIRGDSLGLRLARAAELIAAEREEYPELGAYRGALRATLEGLRDEALLDALVVAQPELDARLDAVVEYETGVRV